MARPLLPVGGAQLSTSHTTSTGGGVSGLRLFDEATACERGRETVLGAERSSLSDVYESLSCVLVEGEELDLSVRGLLLRLGLLLDEAALREAEEREGPASRTTAVATLTRAAAPAAARMVLRVAYALSELLEFDME